MLRRRTLSANTAALLLGNAGSAVLAFVLSALIGRVTGETGLGVYAAVLAWVFPLALLAEFGTNTLLTRDLAAHPEHSRRDLRITGQFRMMSGGASALLLMAAAPLLSDTPAVVAGLRLSAPLLLIEPAYGAYTAVLRAHQTMTPIPLLNLGMLLAQVALTAAAFLMGWGVLAALAVNVVTSLGRMLAAWWIVRRLLRGAPVGSRAVSLRLMLVRAMPFAVAGVLAAAQMRAAFLLLEPLAGVAVVGVYAAAMRFVEAARLLPHAYFDALLPTLSELAARPAALRRTFRRALWSLAGFGLAAGAGFAVVAPLMVRITYGADFAAAVPVLVWAGWMFTPSLLRGGQTLYHYALGQESAVNRVLGVMLVVRVVASLLLIPCAGAVGAVIAGGIAEGVGVVLLGLRSRSIRVA